MLSLLLVGRLEKRAEVNIMRYNKINFERLIILIITLLMIAPMGILNTPIVKAEPMSVQGYIYLSDGSTPAASAEITITEVATGVIHYDVSNIDGSYGAIFESGEWTLYDSLLVQAKGTGSYNGWEGRKFLTIMMNPQWVNVTMDWFYKPPNTNAPHGMPDFPGGIVNALDRAACAVANCFWWFDGKDPQYTNLVTTDPQTLVNNLYSLLGPSPSYMTINQTISDWLVTAGLDSLLYTERKSNPSFSQLTEEIEICSDVILYCLDEDYVLHYLTCSGVNSNTFSLAVSDPLYNMAQNGMGPGRFFNAPLDHWNPANISHDHYFVINGTPISIIYNSLNCEILAAVFLKEYDIDDPPIACFTWVDADGNGAGTVINFNASCSTDDKGIALYEWDWNNDGVYDASSNIPTAIHDYGDLNVHTVIIRVTDTMGQTDIMSDSSVQALGDYPPTACYMWADADGGGSGTLINFNAECSMDDYGLVYYKWDFDNNGVYDAQGITQSHDFGDTDPHTVVLQVTDTSSQTDICSITVKAIESGMIFAWGLNDDGQCNVTAPNSDFMTIQGGQWFSLGLKANGSIEAWGSNNYGACNVPSPNSGFTAIAAGGYHSLGLKADGSIEAWGRNDNNQCDVPSPNSGFTAVAAGYAFSLGLKADGSIVAWGNNNYGQCTVPSPNNGFIAIAAGSRFSLGLKADGSIVVWGQNEDGQCNVPSPNSNFIAVAGGGYHSLGLKSDGSIVGWGRNNSNQCDAPLPNTGFRAIAADGSFSLGLKVNGSIVAWGQNNDGQCVVPSPNQEFIAIAAGYYHSLGIKKTIEIVEDINQSAFDRGFPIRHTIDGDWGAAQNFTPTVNTVTEADIYLRKMGTPEYNLTIELRENHPQGSLLDTVIIPIASVPTSWTWLTIDFDNTTVGIGSDVFIVLPPAPSGVSTSFGYEWGYALGNQYNGGSFWFTRNGGVLWRDLPTMYEFTFKTYGFVSQTQETLSENFEGSFPPTGWTNQVVSGIDPDNYWKINDTVTYPAGVVPTSGIHMAEYDIYIILMDNSARLYTPPLDFSGSGNSLSFMMYHDDDSTTYTDRVVIQVSTDGSTWTDITQFYTWDTTEGWKNHIVDLSAYDGQPSVYVGFLGVSNYGYNNVYIDDVEVSS